MTKYYISKEDVFLSIDYFKNLPLDDDFMLPGYLLTKHLGVTLNKPVTFAGLESNQKDEVLKAVWLLGGLQDKNENGGKNSVLFPNAFTDTDLTSSNFYQSGTEFKKLVGRIKDTIEKKNIHVKLYIDNNKNLTLTRKYKDIIKEKYLNEHKISLKHFACWVLRFIDFDFPNGEPDKLEFTRVVSKTIRSMFKITKNDYLWLFEDDILSSSITASSEIITGTDIRSKFTFSPGDEPEIETIPTPTPFQDISVNELQVSKFIQMTGDNPTDDQIYNTLLQTKQIVLTGVPGVGKSRFLNQLRQKFQYSEMIQFHANYSYEEFIGGDTIQSGDVVSKKGKFLSFVERALNDQNPDNKYLFIIDELNRANIAQVFGETILTLDRGYSVDLAKEIDGIREFKIPNNLFIACSMNSSDRNIAFIDLAIRRRFAFIELYPNYELLSSIAEYNSFDLGDVLKEINNRIRNSLGKEELFLGHSYFLSESIKDNGRYIWNDESFHLQFNFVILPTLREYTLSNPNALVSIIGDQLSTGLSEVTDFSEAFEEEFGKNKE